MRKSLLVLPLVAALALAVGCSKPPQADIDAAKASLEQVRAEAAEYAPDSLRAAEDAQAALEAELKAQEEKFALFRSYKVTGEKVTALKAASEKAGADAAAGKEQAKNEATTLIQDARTSLQETRDMLDKAPRGKGTAADLATLKSDLDGHEAAINDAQSAFDAGRYLEAKTKAEAAKNNVGTVKTEIETAIAAKGGKK